MFDTNTDAKRKTEQQEKAHTSYWICLWGTHINYNGTTYVFSHWGCNINNSSNSSSIQQQQRTTLITIVQKHTTWHNVYIFNFASARYSMLTTVPTNRPKNPTKNPNARKMKQTNSNQMVFVGKSHDRNFSWCPKKIADRERNRQREREKERWDGGIISHFIRKDLRNIYADPSCPCTKRNTHLHQVNNMIKLWKVRISVHSPRLVLSTANIQRRTLLAILIGTYIHMLWPYTKQPIFIHTLLYFAVPFELNRSQLVHTYKGYKRDRNWETHTQLYIEETILYIYTYIYCVYKWATEFAAAADALYPKIFEFVLRMSCVINRSIFWFRR